jgi:hypothetical protein
MPRTCPEEPARSASAIELAPVPHDIDNTLALPRLRSRQRCLQDRTQDDVLSVVRPNAGRQRYSSR